MKRENWKELDGLRGVSILLVVLVHVWSHSNSTASGTPIILSIGQSRFDLSWLFGAGENGVIVFFVLSGFLLYRHWLEKASKTTFTQHAATFYAKRLRRIAPALVVFTLLYIALVALLGRHRHGADLSLSNVLLNLTFTAPFASVSSTNPSLAASLDIVPGTWSLNAEVWFYLFVPSIALLFDRIKFSGPVLLVLSLVGPMYRQMIGDDTSHLLRYSLPGVVDAFFLGMAVAVFSFRGQLTKSVGPLFPLGAIAYVANCASLSPIPFDPAYQLGAASALMVAGLVASGDAPWKRWLSAPWLVHIGHISYSMFLCNILVIWYLVLPIAQVFGIHSSAGGFAINMLLGLPLIIVISHYSYRFIEQPFLASRSSSPVVLFRPVAGITAAIVIASSVPATIAYVIRGGLGTEYRGPLVTFAQTIFPKRLIGLNVLALPLLGESAVDSDTKLAAVSARQAEDGVIQITSTGIATGDRWIAVSLPIDGSKVTRGQSILMKATVSVVKGTPLHTTFVAAAVCPNAGGEIHDAL
jgi:peptidoglycan/LPS O-acetylase OafA/YrhL